MRKKNLLRRTLIIFFCLSVFLSILLASVNAASTSVPGAEGHEVENIITGTFSGGYDSTIFVYSTPNVSDSIKYEINENMAIFEIPSYDDSQWYFDGWRTWYKGSLLGLGVTTSDKANPQYTDGLNYFERNSSLKLVGREYYNAGSMSVYKEDNWVGTYFLSAIFKPIITVNAGDGVTYTVSNGSNVSANKYAVTYGSNDTINYTITDSRYMVTGISVNYGTNYSEQDGKIDVNAIQRPVTIAINTSLKSNVNYTAPTAKTLTYNTKQQELVNKGISSEGTLMYSLEEDGTYSENIPTGKNAGNYTVWYYVKGDSNHLDSEKRSVKVTIGQLNTDIGTVTAEIPNDTIDISKVVLDRTNTTIPGILKVKEGQTLVFGNNEIEYIFMPDDNNYKTIEDKVNVIVTDTIAPEGTISISGVDHTVWDRLLDTITFELFFKSNQMIEVEAYDNLSGIAKIEYYESKEALDIDTLKSLEDGKWQTMSDNSVEVVTEDVKQFVCYVKITDKAGNVMMMSTDGIVLDTVAPVISGVKDGKTYSSTQTIKVTDNNLANVKLNGKDVENKITLKNNKTATYEIVATDRAGNTSSITVKIKNPAESNPPTGDNIMIFIMLALVSIAGLVITIRAKKHRKNN